MWLGACAGAPALLNCNSLYFCCSRIRLGLALLEIYLDLIGFVVVEIKHTIYIFGLALLALLAFLRFLVQMWYIACIFGIGSCSMKKKKSYLFRGL